MAYFTHTTTLVGEGFVHSYGITDLEIIEIGGQWRLYSASFVDGGLAAYTLGPGQAAIALDARDAGASTGTIGVVNLTVATVAGNPVLVPAGQYDDRLAVHTLEADGGFGAIAQLPGTGGPLGHTTDTEVISFGNRSYLFSAQSGEAGLSKWKIRSDLSFRELGHRDDGNATHLGDIVDLDMIQIGRQKFLLAASAFDAGITAYEVDRNGRITFTDSVDADEFSSFAMPSVLDTAKLAGRNFVLMGATGTDTLSVYFFNRKGEMVETDVVRDNLATRFRDIAALEVFTVGGRVFVLAGGSDDGLSLFELSLDGTLFHLQSVADQMGTTLTNVSSIAAHVFGTEVQVFVSGEGEAGITQFSIDVGDIGLTLKGTGKSDTLTGSDADDLIYGGRGWDTLIGGGGSDRIYDGIGKDYMTGGAGADVFVFEPDGRGDIVTDYTPGQDLIDLSRFDMLYHYSAIDIAQKSWGFLLTVKGERIYLFVPLGQPHEVAEFDQSDFIFS